MRHCYSYALKHNYKRKIKQKEIVFNSDEYISFIQKVFQFLYEKNLISLKNGLVVFDDERVYQKGEYYSEGEQYYSLNGTKLKSKIKIKKWESENSH